jgi:hypothetical protein
MRGESETPTEDNKPRAKPRDIIPAPTSPTLAEIWTLYYENRTRLRVGTRISLESRWRNRIAPVLGMIPVTQNRATRDRAHSRLARKLRSALR